MDILFALCEGLFSLVEDGVQRNDIIWKDFFKFWLICNINADNVLRAFTMELFKKHLKKEGNIWRKKHILSA